MENTDHLHNYLTFLMIRQKAYRRNVFIAGALFLIVLLFTTATLLLTDWNVRSIWLMGIFDLLATLNLGMTWAKDQITNEKIDLVKNLQAHEY